jgi:hypothetical protein
MTGGLPRVAELFEAREPKDSFILSGKDGQVELPPLQHEMVVTDEDGKEHVRIIPKGSALLVKDGDKVERNQAVAKGGNITATASGEIAFVMPKNAKQKIVIVTDKGKERPRQFPAGGELLVKNGDKVKKDQQLVKLPPLRAQTTGALTLGRRSGQQKIIITDDEGREKTRNFPVGGKLLVKEGARVKRDQDIAEEAPICAIASGAVSIRSLDSEREAVIRSETGKDIPHSGGKGRLYRWLVEEGDRVERDQAIAEGVSTHAPAGGVARLRPIYGNKQTIVIQGEGGGRWSCAVPKDRKRLVQEGSYVKRGDEIVEGETNPHEILDKRGIEALAAHIVDEVQSVYRMQGVTINDKHIEVIVRQMLRCVIVTDPGDSVYLLEDKLVMSQVMEENERLQAEGKRPLKYRSILLGITKASLATDSVISAASFQETTRVLTDAAVAGKHDNLRGLKENVIIGRIIPAGTGFVHYQQKDRPEETDAAEKTLFEEFSKSADEEGDDEPPAPAPKGEAGGGAEATAGEG